MGSETGSPTTLEEFEPFRNAGTLSMTGSIVSFELDTLEDAILFFDMLEALLGDLPPPGELT